MSDINHRLITCFQSSGRIGKSTALESLISWARFAGIPIATVDCDAEHRTLSKRFPEAAFIDATSSHDEFLQLIMALPDMPMAVADFPAQATDFLLGAVESLRVLDALEAREIRLTVLMFAADDPTATASMAKTYRALGDRADYVLVKNPARFRSHTFDESALAEVFKRKGAPVLDLPPITATTLQAIEAASAEQKRHLTFAEAAKTASIPQICRYEIEFYLNRFYLQCEDNARILIPESAPIQNKVVRPGTKSVQPIDEFNPLSIHE